MRRMLLALGLAVAAQPAAGQTLADYDYENLAFRGIGVDFGYMWPNKVEETQAYRVRIDLGYLGPGVRIVPSISYWQSRYTQRELEVLIRRLAQRFAQEGVTIPSNPELIGPIDLSDIGFALDGQFVWNAPLRTLTYVGIGGALHALNGQGLAIDDTFVEDLLDAISAGIDGTAGVEFRLFRRLRLYLEARYTAMNTMQFATARGGLQFMFPSADEGIRVGAVTAPPAPPLP